MPKIPFFSMRERQTGIIVPLSSSLGYGERISPSFKDMIDYYKTDPNVKGAIDELAETCVGHGFHLTCAEGFEDALEVAEEWCEEINLDGLNQVIARELWATGNCILEKVDPEPRPLVDIVHLPISSFKHIKIKQDGTIISYEQRIGGKSNTIPAKRVIHLAWNPIDGKIGVGLLQPLLERGMGYTWKDASGTTHTEYRPSYREIMEEIEDSMRKVLRRYVPRFVYKFYGFTDDQVSSHASKIKSLRPEDDFIAGIPNKERQELKIDRLTTDPRSRLDPFIEFFHNARYTALETPTLKLFLEAGFTEASARTAVQVLDRKVAAFQRFLKREIERQILKPRVMQVMNWKRESQWKKANIRLNWGQIEQPKVDIEQLIRLADISARTGVQYITPEELRKILAKWGVPLEVAHT